MSKNNTLKKNQRIGLVTTITVHLLLLLVALFVFAWQPPDPPLPQYGIELNFGLDDAGFGDEPVKNTGEQSPQTNQQVTEQPTENTEAQPTETTSTEATETTNKPATEAPTETVDNGTPVQAAAQPEPSPNPKPAEEKKQELPAPPTYNSDADAGKSGSSQGDTKGTTGDQGDEKGSVNAKSLYGTPGAGNGNGAALDMTGWDWDRRPVVKDESDEEGKIVFQVTINDEGDIIGIRTLETTVTPTVEQYYRREVETLSFVRKKDNLTPAPRSTGKITFIIKSR